MPLEDKYLFMMAKALFSLSWQPASYRRTVINYIIVKIIVSLLQFLLKDPFLLLY